MAIVHRRNRKAQADHGAHAVIGTSHPQTNRGAEREARQKYGQTEFTFQPVQCDPNIFHLAFAVGVLALAQSGTAKVEAQHGKAKSVQGLHGMKNNFIVQRPAEEGMRMSHQRAMSRVFATFIQ